MRPEIPSSPYLPDPETRTLFWLAATAAYEQYGSGALVVDLTSQPTQGGHLCGHPTAGELEMEDENLSGHLDEYEPAHEFIYTVRHRLSDQWSSWLARVKESAVKEVKNHSMGLKRDAAAVYAAIDQPWSNGTTEGNENRLKSLKCQMYGKASFELLRLRLLFAD